jgi:aminopeptidase N
MRVLTWFAVCSLAAAPNADPPKLRIPDTVSGQDVLHISYQGKISRNSSAGLFQMKQADQWYVYSQFEPTDARRAFPCSAARRGR